MKKPVGKHIVKLLSVVKLFLQLSLSISTDSSLDALNAFWFFLRSFRVSLKQYSMGTSAWLGYVSHDISQQVYPQRNTPR